MNSRFAALALTLLGTATLAGNAAAQMLNQGDVAIVEVQGTGDSFSFVALTNIPANASIAWTDESWLPNNPNAANGPTNGGFNGNGTGEQGFNLIAIPAGGIAAGTVTTVAVAAGLGANGESVHLFNNLTPGSTPPTAPTSNPGTGLLWVNNWGNAGFVTDPAAAPSSATTTLAPALASFNTALPTGAGWTYNGPLNGTRAQIIANLENPNQWVTTTANAFSNPNGTAFTVVPEPGTYALVGLGLAGLVLFARRSRRQTV